MTAARDTGGNRGIGRAVAAALRGAGLDVVLTAQDGGEGADAADAIGCRRGPMDVADDASVDAALAEVGRIAVQVNDAGMLRHEGLFDDPSPLDATLAVMVRAPWRPMRATLPGIGAEGRGVNRSSRWGSFGEGSGGGGAYAAGKAAPEAPTVRAAAQAEAEVDATGPGWVRTRMGGADATRAPDEAADTAPWLATLAADGPTGGVVRDRRPIPW